ncbi:MAG: formylmethanofuran dehydrogenase subunit C [Candidatus Thiodiazotropha sp.]
MSGLTLTLRLLERLSQRIDMTPFTPHGLAGKSPNDIARLPLWLGNRQVDCGELFNISGSLEDEVIIQSDSDRLDRIGAGMTGGCVRVEGNAGAYLGCGMRNGTIEVSGNAGLAAGCAMSGGSLTIGGNAGDFLGGALTGDRQGMRGGRLTVKGNVGDRAGDLLRRGTILIGGDCGDYCASRMIAGTLVVLGHTGIQTGHAMRRGTLIVTRHPKSMPATFNDNGNHQLSFLTLLTHHLGEHAPFSALAERGNRVQRWVGDLSCDGKGEILLLE